MKKRIVFLFGLLLVLICLSTAVAEDAVTPADQPFQNEAIEQAHLIAQAKLKKDYVYDPRLFTCILKAETDEAFEFTFNWVYSTVAIYTVSVPADLDENHIEVIYNTDYFIESYYTELCACFCPQGGLFGDWTIDGTTVQEQRGGKPLKIQDFLLYEFFHATFVKGQPT